MQQAMRAAAAGAEHESANPRRPVRVPGLLAGLLLLAAGNAMAGEEAKYAVLLDAGRFELREYAPQIVAETVVDGAFEDAGDAAFSRLFRYISGHNSARRKVAMTAPVGQAEAGRKIDMTAPVGQTRSDGRWVVSFMMPASFTLDTLPQPKDPQVVLRQVPARNMAVVRYSGFWSEKRYRRNLARLRAWLEEREIRALGEPVWARYNPPFMPWFLRRNEILIPIGDGPHGG